VADDFVRDRWLAAKFKTLHHLLWLAFAGAIIFSLSLGLQTNWRAFWPGVVLGILLLAPLLFYLVILTIWHWKERYIGDHSNLWGALLLIETSGWFKIVYWFRHILPDWRGTGRYRRSNPEAANAPLAPPRNSS
jgi:hypothetical protein